MYRDGIVPEDDADPLGERLAARCVDVAFRWHLFESRAFVLVLTALDIDGFHPGGDRVFPRRPTSAGCESRGTSASGRDFWRERRVPSR